MSKVRFKNKPYYGRPPEQAAWVWHTSELLRSPAWHGASLNLRRLIDYLEIEHLRHDRMENGRLIALYDDLAKFGISRSLTLRTILEGEARGLIEVDHGLCAANGQHEPSKYRLTYLPTYTTDLTTKAITEHRETNEWRRYSEPQKTRKSGKNQVPDLRLGKSVSDPPKVVPGPVPDLRLGEKPEASVSAKIRVSDPRPGPSTRSETPYLESRCMPADRDQPAASRLGDVPSTCRAYVTNATGYRLCGQPVGEVGVHCPEHAARLPGNIRQ